MFSFHDTYCHCAIEATDSPILPEELLRGLQQTVCVLDVFSEVVSLITTFTLLNPARYTGKAAKRYPNPKNFIFKLELRYSGQRFRENDIVQCVKRDEGQNQEFKGLIFPVTLYYLMP